MYRSTAFRKQPHAAGGAVAHVVVAVTHVVVAAEPTALRVKMISHHPDYVHNKLFSVRCEETLEQLHEKITKVSLPPGLLVRSVEGCTQRDKIYGKAINRPFPDCLMLSNQLVVGSVAQVHLVGFEIPPDPKMPSFLISPKQVGHLRRACILMVVLGYNAPPFHTQ